MWKELKQLCGHSLLGLLVLTLPWSWAFSILRFSTRFGVGKTEVEAAAVKNMQRFGYAANEYLTVRQIRLHRIIDLADFYKSWCMRRAWLRRYWRVSGDSLPDAQEHPAILFVTFHYGAGFWALRYFQQHGLSMAALYRPPPKPKAGEYFDYYFFWWRLRSIFRLTGTKPIRVGDQKSELSALVRRLIRDSLPVGVMPDIPTAPSQAVSAKMFGRTIYFASALLRLVVKKKIPIVLYTSVLDLTDGGRNVHLQVLDEYTSVEALAQILADCLAVAIEKDPSAWHLWPWAHEILTNPET